MFTTHRPLLTLLVSSSIAALAACSSGGGGGSSSSSTTGMAMPDKLSVVTAKSTSAKPTVAGIDLPYKTIAGVVTQQTFAATSDYATDKSNTWVHDESMNSLKTVNMILCLMAQTKASDMVNKGAYVALVNENKCEEGKNTSQASSSGGQSSGNTVDQLNRWVIESTRANSASPQIVKIWVPGKASADPYDKMATQNIMVEVNITEGTSAAKPFGAFTLNFQGLIDASAFGGTAGQTITSMRGTLIGEQTDTGKPHFRFINAGGFGSMFSMEEAADVVLNDATGTGGVAKTKEYYSDASMPQPEDSVFAIAFDDAYLLRGKYNSAGTAQGSACLDRNGFRTNLWRYNLYFRDAGTFEGKAVTAGQRVERSSGFPFRYTDAASGQTYNGHAGYWGIWMEDESKIAQLDGKTITKFNYNGNTGTTTDYVAHVAPGKATLRTAHPAGLSTYNGMEFYGWLQHPTLGDPSTNNFNSWLVKINGSTLTITHGVTWGNNGPVKTAVTPANLTWSGFDGETIWLWSDALGGNVAITHTANGDKVVFYSQEFVYPGDFATLASGGTTIALNCYDRCPKGGLNQTDVNNAAGNQNALYYTTTWGSATYHPYTLMLSGGKVLLRDDTNSLMVSVAGLNLTSLGTDGLQSGEMVRQSVTLANPWEIYQHSETFRWETGNQNWNRMVTITDANNNAVSFDKPLNFTYQVATADLLNPYLADGTTPAEAAFTGQTFMLQYGGAGELWGFPWTADANCADTTGKNCRWYPGVNLKSGVELSLGGTTFVVKGMEGEQSMNIVSTNICTSAHTGNASGLQLAGANALVLPTAANLGTVSFTWSARPDLTSAPAVIEGTVQ